MKLLSDYNIYCSDHCILMWICFWSKGTDVSPPAFSNQKVMITCMFSQKLTSRSWIFGVIPRPNFWKLFACVCVLLLFWDYLGALTLFLKYCAKTGNTIKENSSIAATIWQSASLLKFCFVCITISSWVQSSVMLMKVPCTKKSLCKCYLSRCSIALRARTPTSLEPHTTS